MHVVLIGGSGFGRYHLQIWRKHPRVSALTVVGRNPDSLAATAAEFDVAVSTDLAAALDQADLVDVVTPTDTHAALARQALDHGRPTLVETALPHRR